MPYRPRKRCGQLGCPRIIEAGRRLCPDHARQAERSRGSASSRGYGARWRRLRRLVLESEPWCRACGTNPATEVDHIVSKTDGGSDAIENLQGLCKSCHSRKTMVEAVQR
jgi:5-methylcytosine-specific restriction protein A